MDILGKLLGTASALSGFFAIAGVLAIMSVIFELGRRR